MRTIEPSGRKGLVPRAGMGADLTVAPHLLAPVSVDKSATSGTDDSGAAAAAAAASAAAAARRASTAASPADTEPLQIVDPGLMRWAMTPDVGLELDPTMSAGAWTDNEIELRRVQRQLQLRALYEAEYNELLATAKLAERERSAAERPAGPTTRSASSGAAANAGPAGGDAVEWRRAHALKRYASPRRADAAARRAFANPDDAAEGARLPTCTWTKDLPLPPSAAGATTVAGEDGPCALTCLPGSPFCLEHILWDPQQRLYVPCRGDGRERCGRPVSLVSANHLCAAHRHCQAQPAAPAPAATAAATAD